MEITANPPRPNINRHEIKPQCCYAASNSMKYIPFGFDKLYVLQTQLKHIYIRISKLYQHNKIKRKKSPLKKKIFIKFVHLSASTSENSHKENVSKFV